MTQKKKVKSVERQKEDKQKTDKSLNKGDVVAIKRANKGSLNQNVNKQAVQIIFPSDMELRKVKKPRKRKPKKDSEREALLEQLKGLLAEYDKDRQEADEKKITVPSDIGLPTINASEIKTNAHIKAFIDEVATKLQRLRELIQRSTSTTSQPNMWGLPQGGFRSPQQLMQTPQPTGQIQIVPPAGLPTRVPILISSTGAGVSAGVDPKLAALQQIARETQTELEHEGIDTSTISPPATTPTTTIPSQVRPPIDFDEVRVGVANLLKLPPQQRIDKGNELVKLINHIQDIRLRSNKSVDSDFVSTRNILLVKLDSIIEDAKIELQKGTQPATGTTTGTQTGTQLSPPAEDLNLTTEKINMGGGVDSITAPADWVEQVRQVLKYQKDILFDAEERPKGYFHIPISKMQNLIREREQLSNQYSSFMESLTEQQLAYIDAKYAVIDKRIRQILMEEPKETLKFVFDKQGRPYKDITQAGERTKIELETEEALKAGKSLKDPFIDAQVKLIEKKIKDTKAKYKTKSVAYQTAISLNTLQPIQNLENDKKELDKMNKDLEDTFSKLPDNAQALTGVAFENATQDYQVLRGMIDDYQNVLTKLIKDSNIKKTDKLFNELNSKLADHQVPIGYVPYKFRDNDMRLLKIYSEREGGRASYSPVVQRAVLNVFGILFLDYLKGRSSIDKRTIIGQALKDIGNKSPQQFSKEFFKLGKGQSDIDFLKPHQMTREEWEKKQKEEAEKAKKAKGGEEGHSWQFAKA